MGCFPRSDLFCDMGLDEKKSRSRLPCMALKTLATPLEVMQDGVLNIIQ